MSHVVDPPTVTGRTPIDSRLEASFVWHKSFGNSKRGLAHDYVSFSTTEKATRHLSLLQGMSLLLGHAILSI
jgi:hypothetical protein